jgi:trehalose 6-phosphate synthase/phosphatase
VATGLASLRASDESLWIGWAEGVSPRADAEERESVRTELRERYACEPVFLSADDIAGFYHGFSNRTLWPLFHYFGQDAEFDPSFWRAYERANRKYRDAVLEVYRPGDRIWIHDYQLMLLPQLLRERLPDASIGFFLHIPFPSFELFRLLPWRRELIEGVLGAGLIGFHTHDYVRHFLSSAQSLLGLEDRDGRLRVESRVVLVDAFPMGIDYQHWVSGVETRAAKRERRRVGSNNPNQRIVLSLDRLDYTKGIPARLRAFDTFLERHPEWRGRATMVCVAVPSRSRVERYRKLKREVDALVGDINGRHGTIEWTPIQYLYRSVPANTLLGLYAAADVALVTPLRDGMNLIAKEYVATHADKPGVLVLSEMAGAARELTEAIIVNPSDEQRVANAIFEALEMPEAEQLRRSHAMQQRLERYDANRWAAEYLGRLEEVAMLQLAYDEHKLSVQARDRMLQGFAAAPRRLLLLDYDGTLVTFDPRPECVAPDPQLLDLLRQLSADQRNTVAIISGRDPDTLDRWFGEIGVSLIAEHGAWAKEPGCDWGKQAPNDNAWMDEIRRVLELFADRTPGSFVEEKDVSLAWHYRSVQPELARRRRQEITEALGSLTQDFGLSMLDGNKVIEVINAGIDKGRAAYRWMGRVDYEFILAVGDDVTDESVFELAPQHAWTIKVGSGATRAAFVVSGPPAVRSLLGAMASSGTGDHSLVEAKAAPPAKASRAKKKPPAKSVG